MKDALRYTAAKLLPSQPDVEHVMKQALASVAPPLLVGGLVISHIANPPFRPIAAHTRSWSNRVGSVVQVQEGAVQIAQSRVPRSGVTTPEHFVERWVGGHIALMCSSGPTLKR